MHIAGGIFTHEYDVGWFPQVVIFVKSVSRARELDKLLNECQFPSIAIHGGLPQEQRIKLFQQFKAFEKRVLVATDVFGRVERVNIVINYDTPGDADSYLHRVGRAGRFGTKGLAITFVSNDENEEVLKAIQSRFEVAITELPETIDASTYSTSTSLFDLSFPVSTPDLLTEIRSERVKKTNTRAPLSSFCRFLSPHTAWPLVTLQSPFLLLSLVFLFGRSFHALLCVKKRCSLTRRGKQQSALQNPQASEEERIATPHTPTSP